MKANEFAIFGQFVRVTAPISMKDDEANQLLHEQIEMLFNDLLKEFFLKVNAINEEFSVEKVY